MKRFVSGGTVQASNGIYISRQADEELYELCLEGEYAAVLTARQRGKSSLMVNVTDHLRQEGINVATVDISPFGQQANPDDWYCTILEIIASRNNLSLTTNVVEWWKSQAPAYPLASRRFALFFETVVLKNLQGRIVIFIDEIDKTFSLPFTDDFFIGVRAMYNQRSQDVDFQRLSFVLLGVASPTELIKSKTSTPYNIGRQIELADFSLDELIPFQTELVNQSGISKETAIFIKNAIYFWTSGHPYLTQRLFKEISLRSVENKDWDQKSIDQLVDALFLKSRNASDNNIIEVKQRLDFAKLTSNNAVELYYKILFTPIVLDDQEDLHSKTFLKLSGVVTSHDGKLEIRNRIYEKVLGIDWFNESYTKYNKKPPTELVEKYKTKDETPSNEEEHERLLKIEQEKEGSTGPFDFSSLFDDAPFVDTTSTNKDPEDLSEESKLAAMRRRRQSLVAQQRPGAGKQNNSYLELKTRVQNKLISELDHTTMDVTGKNEVRTHIEELFNKIVADESIVLSRSERINLFESIISEILGFGPLEVLLADDTITEIMVNGPKSVYIEQKGNLYRANVTFENEEHVLRILDRIVAPLGRSIDEKYPFVAFRLPDGSRGSAVIRPISLGGPTLTLRKFSKRPLTIDDLIRFGAMTADIASFLRACIIARIQILVVGGVGSGKLTLLNVLSSFIPNDERIITVERVAELQLRQEHVVTLETRGADSDGYGGITITDLAHMALTMRPDRVIFGDLEVDDVEAYLDTAGRLGSSLAMVLADDVDSALNFLEISVLRTSPNMTVEHVRNWISGTFKLIVVQQRLRDGSRKITQIVELTKLAPGRYGIEPIFVFEQTGIEGGRIIGRIKPTGRRPSFSAAFESFGIHLPPSLFGLGRNY